MTIEIKNKLLIRLRNELKHLPQTCQRPVFNEYAKLCPLLTNEADCVIDCENEIIWICSYCKRDD